MVWSRLGLVCRPSSVYILDKLEWFLASARSHGNKSFDYASCIESIELALLLNGGGSAVDMSDVVWSIIHILILFDKQQLQYVVLSFPTEHRETKMTVMVRV